MTGSETEPVAGEASAERAVEDLAEHGAEQEDAEPAELTAPPADLTAAAFFDVDNTMVHGSSLVHFARGLAARKYFTYRDVMGFVYAQAKFQLTGRENSDDVAEGKQKALSFIEGRPTSELVTLGEEIGFLESYLGIEQARFGDRLGYRILVPDDVREARVPTLILQPLVENALHHGIAARAGPGRVEIGAARHGDVLRLVVADDGPGLPQSTSERIGLANTRARLQLLYADRQRFHVRNAEAGGVLAEIELPWRTTP